MERRIIKAQRRLLNSKHSLNENRKLGVVPGVLYGNKVGNIAISVAEKDFRKMGGSQIIEVTLPGGSYSAMVREVQKHPVSGRISHIDLQQVEMDQRVKTLMAVRVTGEPAVSDEGTELHLGERELEVEAYPQDLTAYLETDISNLVRGQKITVADLQRSYPNIRIISDPDLVIASIASARVEEINKNGTEPAVEQAANAQKGAEIEKESE